MLNELVRVMAPLLQRQLVASAVSLPLPRRVPLSRPPPRHAAGGATPLCVSRRGPLSPRPTPSPRRAGHSSSPCMLSDHCRLFNSLSQSLLALLLDFGLYDEHAGLLNLLTALRQTRSSPR